MLLYIKNQQYLWLLETWRPLIKVSKSRLISESRAERNCMVHGQCFGWMCYKLEHMVFIPKLFHLWQSFWNLIFLLINNYIIYISWSPTFYREYMYPLGSLHEKIGACTCMIITKQCDLSFYFSHTRLQRQRQGSQILHFTFSVVEKTKECKCDVMLATFHFLSSHVSFSFPRVRTVMSSWFSNTWKGTFST